jgi:hypothetical protein
MDSLSSTIDKTIGLVNVYLDLIVQNTNAQTNVSDQLTTASKLSDIVQILIKAQASQETSYGQEAQEETTTKGKISASQKGSTLKDIFSDSNDQ